MKQIMRAILVFVLLGLFVFLGVYMSTHNMGVLNPKGVIAVAEKNLMITAVGLMLIIVIPVFVMLFSFAWIYREGNTKARYTPDWHNNIALEITWWAVPTIIIIILGYITWKSTHELDPHKPLNSNVAPITIQVVALDWKWLFIYPDENIATVNYLQIPKDVPINFKITADAPMNGFWIPQLAGQVYAMAGMTARLSIMANEEGHYSGLSSNFSGEGFSGMKFRVQVTSEDGYKKWLETVRSSPEALSFSEYGELALPSNNNPMVFYASVEENLYNKVLMKFMPEMQHAEKETHMMHKME